MKADLLTKPSLALVPTFMRAADGLRAAAGLHAAVWVLAASLSTSVSAQPPSVLNRIIFEPQPLTIAATPAVSTSMQTESSGSAVQDAPPGPLRAADTDDAKVDAYLQSISAIELEGGPFAPGLLEQYLALGEAHQQRNDHEAALAAFEKADYISRINNGLYSPEQFAIVENMIESHFARNEIPEASNKQRYLLLLHEQQYGESSLDLVPALANIGDWNFSIFNRQLTLPNTVFSISNGSGGFGGNAPSPRAMAFGSLMQSQMNYWRAINIMLDNHQYNDPQLRELENKLIETSFLTSNRDGLIRNPDFYLSRRSVYTGTRIQRSARPNSPYFFTGRSAYERLMAYHFLTPGADAVAVARTIIALGDWNLLFDRQGAAIRTYERAHEFMVANKVPKVTIDALLSPGMPQQLPAFTPFPHSRAKFGIAPDAEIAWDGYVDVSFRISRFGQAGRFEILDSSGPLTEDMESRLNRLIRSSPFRPRFTDGEPKRRDEVTLRYYFAQLE